MHAKKSTPRCRRRDINLVRPFSSSVWIWKRPPHWFVQTSVHYLKRLGRFPKWDRIIATALKRGQTANTIRMARLKIQISALEAMQGPRGWKWRPEQHQRPCLAATVGHMLVTNIRVVTSSSGYNGSTFCLVDRFCLVQVSYPVEPIYVREKTLN